MRVNRQTIIDVKEGRITNPYSQERIVLVGNYIYADSTYVDKMDIILNTQNGGTIITHVPYSGYDMQLYIGDFNGDGKDEIMLRGAYNGSEHCELGIIYTFENGELKQIFNTEQFSKDYPLSARYLDDYKVIVESSKLKKRYSFDISDNPTIYLRQIYDEKGKLISDLKPSIGDVNGVFPINILGQKNPYLLIRQKVGGISNADYIGYVEIYIRLLNNEIEVVDSGGYERGNSIVEGGRSIDEFVTILPLGSIVTNSEQIADENDKIIAYTLEGVPHIALIKVDNGKNSLQDDFKGPGYKVKEIIIRKYGQKTIVLVGFELGGNKSTLEAFEYEHGTIKKIQEVATYYSKLYLEDLNGDGNQELILWTQDTGEAYMIDIYEFKQGKFKKTHLYDASYYVELIPYYEELVTKTKGSPTYLYYLALAYIKVGNYKKALESIEKDLKAPYPYPNTQKLEYLKKWIEKK